MDQEESLSRCPHSQDLVVRSTPSAAAAFLISSQNLDEPFHDPAAVVGTSAVARLDTNADYDADISQSVEEARPRARSRSFPRPLPIPSDIESEADVSDEAFLPEVPEMVDVFGPTAMTRPGSIIRKRSTKSRPLSDAQSQYQRSLS